MTNQCHSRSLRWINKLIGTNIDCSCYIYLGRKCVSGSFTFTTWFETEMYTKGFAVSCGVFKKLFSRTYVKYMPQNVFTYVFSAPRTPLNMATISPPIDVHNYGSDTIVMAYDVVIQLPPCINSSLTFSSLWRIYWWGNWVVICLKCRTFCTWILFKLMMNCNYWHQYLIENLIQLVRSRKCSRSYTPSPRPSGRTS